MEAFADPSFADWVDDDSMLAMMEEVEDQQGLDSVDSQQPKVLLTPEQQLVVELVREGKVAPFDCFMIPKLVRN